MKNKFKLLFWLFLTITVMLPMGMYHGFWCDFKVARPTGLRAIGHVNEVFDDTMVFENLSEKEGDENIAVLRLKLRYGDKNGESNMEFEISGSPSQGRITAGTYAVAKDAKGYLDYMDGVFGFAEIKAFGEAPFFVNHGEIKINESDRGKVKGYMNVTLVNGLGNKFKLHGDFVAMNQ